jgi:hypothetical protein
MVKRRLTLAAQKNIKTYKIWAIVAICLGLSPTNRVEEREMDSSGSGQK